MNIYKLVISVLVSMLVTGTAKAANCGFAGCPIKRSHSSSNGAHQGLAPSAQPARKTSGNPGHPNGLTTRRATDEECRQFNAKGSGEPFRVTLNDAADVEPLIREAAPRFQWGSVGDRGIPADLVEWMAFVTADGKVRKGRTRPIAPRERIGEDPVTRIFQLPDCGNYGKLKDRGKNKAQPEMVAAAASPGGHWEPYTWTKKTHHRKIRSRTTTTERQGGGGGANVGRIAGLLGRAMGGQRRQVQQPGYGYPVPTQPGVNQIFNEGDKVVQVHQYPRQNDPVPAPQPQDPILGNRHGSGFEAIPRSDAYERGAVRGDPRNMDFQQGQIPGTEMPGGPRH